MISLRQESPEVFYAADGLVAIGDDDVAELKRRAEQTPRRRCRICFHSDPKAPLHEMLIVHEGNAWVPPHKHIGKSESVQVIEGTALLVSFTETGDIEDAIRIGDGGAAYCRMPDGLYHTLLIDSDWFVFKETILGPFDRTKTVNPPWAPSDEGAEADLFMEQLRLKLHTMEINI